MWHQITEVAAVDNDRTVLCTVAYWYGVAPGGPPDFLEHHRVRLPAAALRLVLNDMRQPVRVDGTFGFSYVDVDGEWVPWEPDPGDPEYQWEQVDVDFAALIAQAVDRRAGEVRAARPRGEDLFPAHLTPRPRDPVGHVAGRSDVAALRGRQVQS